MPYYESIFIARQDIQSAQVEAITKEFEEIVKANGGAVKKTEQWGLRTLAYRIRKNKKGHYVLFNIDAPAAAIEEMERNMRLHEDILRYMTIKVEELEEGPSVMMRRDDQDGGERSSRRPLRQKADK
jgi:small subunit ribosomal protein S6